VKRRALLSTSDKRGLAELGRGLVELGWELISTGGTARVLRDAGLEVLDVSAVTGHPEMMDGRVKTLHPAVHAGLLARRERPTDLEAMEAQGYQPIDLVAVNLYPFHEAAARGAPLAEAMEQVDIGGPTMLRAAAKNHTSVIVLVDPADYDGVLAALHGAGVSPDERRRLAAKVFRHTARYDAAIADYFDTAIAREHAHPVATEFPETLALGLTRVQPLRYGENPDQPAAFYADTDAPAGSLPHLRQLHGKELSFNNLLDVESAVTAISAWQGDPRAGCVIIKHNTPCGVALASSPAAAWERALACDPVSAFGGVVAFNQRVPAEAAEALSTLFLEIVIAPDFEPDALEILQRKKNLRLIQLPVERSGPGELDYKRVRGGFLVQTRMSMRFPEEEWRVVTRRSPSESEMEDLRFAWRVCASVKSNAIVLARDARTLGIGAGQMSRVDSSRIAVMKAADTGADTTGAALASDAFFPFRDGIDAAANAGIRAVIQPGGALRDSEVIEAANEHDLAMVFTGRRLFRH
jgi:phosphoribosylaminoimidazolecarboxamide formyltransferase/IMP cyclohydrolase